MRAKTSFYAFKAFAKTLDTPNRPGSDRLLVDGDLSRHPDQFWASDPAKEQISWILLDFGEPQPRLCSQSMKKNCKTVHATRRPRTLGLT